MKLKKITSFILSLIMAVSGLNMCFAQTQANDSSETKTMDTVVSGSAVDEGISLTATSDRYEYPVEGGNIYIEISEGEATVIRADSTITKADIPSSIDGYSVTSIDNNAFMFKDSLTSVTIPDSVTNIGESAFAGSPITSITIPDSVIIIGSGAFKWCDSLTSITFGSGVITHIDDALGRCKSLKEINVSEENEEYSSMDGVLYNKDKTKLVKVPEGKEIQEFIVPGSVTCIGWQAFQFCSTLTSINIPDSVTSIEDYAFNNCTSLKNVTIGNGVASIGYMAFSVCNSLTNITLPAGVTSISDGSAFSYTPLTEINVNENNTAYTSVDGILYNKDKTELIKIPERKGIKEFNIPDSVTSIGGFALARCTSLTSVTIPDSVASIGDCAFESCSRLTSITIPDSVTSIGEDAFIECTSLTSITIPDSITYLGDYAFYGCNQDKLTFYVKQGSYADTWAKENGWKVSYDTAPTVSTTTTTTTTETTTQPTTTTVTTQDTTKAPTTQTTTQKATEKPTENTTQKVTEKPTETTTQTVTEKPTETTTQTVTEKPTETTTQTITETGTETTTRRVSSGGGGGGRSSSSSKAKTEQKTEQKTEEKTEQKAETPPTKTDQNTAGNKTAPTAVSEVRIAINSNVIKIDGKEYKMDTAPYIQTSSNSTLVPLRFVASVLLGDNIENVDTSKTISWNAVTKQATVTIGTAKAVFTAGSNIVEINGVKTAMENGVKAEIKDGRMFVPFRTIGNLLGIQVDWDAETKTAIYKVK